MGILGYWTYAEIAAGIVASCMPALPKFYRTLGPNVRRCISSLSRSSGITPYNIKGSTTSRPFANRGGRNNTEDLWSDPDEMWIRLRGDLEDSETMRTERVLSSGPAQQTPGAVAVGQATLRAEFESGYHDGEILRTTRIKPKAKPEALLLTLDHSREIG